MRRHQGLQAFGKLRLAGAWLTSQHHQRHCRQSPERRPVCTASQYANFWGTNLDEFRLALKKTHAWCVGPE